MLMPVVIEWCRRRQVSPSRLLLPLSYLTILGGVCSLIGTSTTLVAQGKLRELQAAYETQWIDGRAQRPGATNDVAHNAIDEDADGQVARGDAGTRSGEVANLGASQHHEQDGALFVHQLRPMTLFEIGQVGLPCGAAGALFLLCFGQRLLPDRPGHARAVWGSAARIPGGNASAVRLPIDRQVDPKTQACGTFQAFF